MFDTTVLLPGRDALNVSRINYDPHKVMRLDLVADGLSIAVGQRILEVMQSNRDAKCALLFSCNRDDRPPQELVAQLLERLPTSACEEVWFYHQALDPEYSDRVLRALQRFNALSYLNIHGCVINVAPLLPTLPRLNTIILDACRLKDEDVMLIAQRTDHASVVSLDDNNVTDVGIRRIVDHLVRRTAYDEIKHHDRPFTLNDMEFTRETTLYVIVMSRLIRGERGVEVDLLEDDEDLNAMIDAEETLPDGYMHSYRSMHAFLGCDRAAPPIDKDKAHGAVRRFMSEAGDRNVPIRVLRMLLG